MSATGRRPSAAGSTDPYAVLVPFLFGLFLLLALVTTAAAHLAVHLFGWAPGQPASAHRELPGNPFTLTLGLFGGTVARPAHLIGTAVALLAPVVLLAVVVGVWWFGRAARREDVDAAARHLAGPRELARLHGRGATANARRLGATRPDGTPAGPGLPVGTTLPVGLGLGGGRGRDLVQGWEDVSVDIWGPRAGKTTCRVIPAILAAPGAVLVTSNKRDVLDTTLCPRRASRGPVTVFDPQGVAATVRGCWWDPLSFVTDLTRARTLASVFAAAGREPGAHGDAYFDPAARELVAALLLAAASTSLPIGVVHSWVTTPDDGPDGPVGLLEQAGHRTVADALARTVALPDRQRAGVYGTAAQMLAFLIDPAILPWITPDAATPGFDPHAWLQDAGTLYCLSKEGPGSAGAVVAALTVAVVDAAETAATRSPSGRLATPLVCVLDEAANVCRWPDLPDLYSHHGSRGIVLMTILQSWAQGEAVWGTSGMRKLWSAANLKVLGPGVADVAFLDDCARLAGHVDLPAHTTTLDARGRSTSRTTRPVPVLDVADLAALPRGRAWLLTSGARPTLIATTPWTRTQHADTIQASITDAALRARLQEQPGIEHTTGRRP
jgi:type IV secretory pathway TraG/TraD family ATPase VirD4